MEILWSLGLTLHLGLAGDLNPIHPHVRINNNGVIAGAYYNSLDVVSTYAGYRYEYNQFGVETAAVTGYNQPVVPYVRGTYDTDNMRIFIAPGLVDDTIGVVIGVELTIK